MRGNHEGVVRIGAAPFLILTAAIRDERNAMFRKIKIKATIDDKGSVVVTKYCKKAAKVMPQREFEVFATLLVKSKMFSLQECFAEIGKIIHQRRESRRKPREARAAVGDESVTLHQ
jgi:hypothetical protein